MGYNYQDASMESQQEYFGKVHTDNKETLQNALKRIEELEGQVTRAFEVLKGKRKRIEELEAQIEEMKCCGNCSHFKLDNSGLYPIYVCELTYPNKCKNHDKWEIKEND